jgi:pimeloyl-ACP methyl ester carboxylesterase
MSFCTVKRIFVLTLFAFFALFHTASAATPIQGTLPTGTTIWTKAASPYLITDTLTIPIDATLTIEPGTIIKIGGNFFVYIYGILNAGEGTSTEPVIFTSSKDDSVGGDSNSDATSTTPLPGDWLSLYFADGAQGTFTNTILRYGGKQNGPTLLNGLTGHIFNQGGNITISNSRLSDSATVNLRQSGGTTTITDSTITTAPYGVFIGNGHFSIHHSSITNHTHYGIWNYFSPFTVDATNNWWGTPTGPFHWSLNATGTGNPVSDDVTFAPWLTSDPAEPVPVCTINCYSNVLFLPGIEASRLYDKTGHQLWEPFSDGSVSKLELDANGKGNPLHGISTQDVIEEAYGSFNIYQSFESKLKNMKDTQHLIADYAVVPYDWRLSLEDILNGGTKTGAAIDYTSTSSDPYILSELRRLAASSRTHKVTIVAHSNGGMVTKLLTNKLGGEASQLIDRIIFVAVPQVGTPQAIAALLHGYNQGIPSKIPLVLSEREARKFAQNAPVAYNLLPSKDYFTYIDNAVVTLEGSTTFPNWQIINGTKVHSPELLHSFLLDTEGRVASSNSHVRIATNANPTLLAQAEGVHATLDRWIPPAGVEFIQIAGWGIPSTVSGVHYSGLTGAVCGTTNDCAAAGIATALPDYDTTIDGDGTVVTPSALWVSTTTSVQSYWINLGLYNSNHQISTLGGLFPFSHANILEVSELDSFIADKLTGNPQPLSSYTYLSTAAPQSMSKRLKYVLHSPLTLDLYDNQGRHTGVSTTTGKVEEEIPGTYFTQFDDVKYLYTNASTTSHIVMSGYATGTFTFTISELRGDTLLASTTFKDLPTTPSTKVTLHVESDIRTVSPMQIDQNGDGIIDFSLTPKLGGVVTIPTPDLTAPTTTATTIGTQGKHTWYTSNVVVTLSATDTESGIASTTYSLNGGAWLAYTAPLSISAEGTTTLRYRSIDKAGNTEATHMLIVKIDKTAPEAQISVSTSTQDLLIEGTDNLSTTTVSKDTSGNYTITDQAGHITKLFFTKTYTGKFLTSAKLTGIQYDTQAKITLPTSSFLYLWDTKVTPPVLVSQTITANDTFLITALYDKKTNKTTIIILKKKLPYQVLTFTGLKVVKLVTARGVVGYGW